jgi:hypothetical protein
MDQDVQKMQPPRAAADRRGAPRLRILSRDVRAKLSDLGVSVDIAVDAKDISVTGVCFFTDRGFHTGSEVEVTVSKVFSLTATVLSCEMEETDPNLLEVRYRVRCRFTDEHQGIELLAMAKDTGAMAVEMGHP